MDRLLRELYRQVQQANPANHFAKKVFEFSNGKYVCKLCGYVTTKAAPFKRHLRHHYFTIKTMYFVDIERKPDKALNMILECLKNDRKKLTKLLNSTWALVELAFIITYDVLDKYNPIERDVMLLELAKACDSENTIEQIMNVKYIELVRAITRIVSGEYKN